jgi:hypothetical protein
MKNSLKLNVIELIFANFIFALAGLFSYSVVKDSDWEQLFLIAFTGTVFIFNLIRCFFLFLILQELKIRSGAMSTFESGYSSGKKALTNNIPKIKNDVG